MEKGTFGRGFEDFLFGRLTVDGVSSLSTDQLLVTAAVAVGSFFLGNKVIAKGVWHA